MIVLLVLVLALTVAECGTVCRTVPGKATGCLETPSTGTGWQALTIHAVDAFSAGLVEGQLLAKDISAQYDNTFFGVPPSADAVFRAYFNSSEAYLVEMIKENERDVYWEAVADARRMLAGVASGAKLDYYTLWLLNAGAELGDVYQAASPSSSLPVFFSERGKRCSSFVRFSRDEGFTLAHATWSTYASMNRVFKKYNFEGLFGVGGSVNVSFSGYPGIITSQDDYYTLAHSRLVVTETTFSVYNQTLYKDYINPVGTVPEFIRVSLANALAVDAHDWHAKFALRNSGTYNNEWIIANAELLLPGQEASRLADGAVVVGNQAPGIYVYEDMTSKLRERGWLASYNVPSIKRVYDFAGWQGMADNNTGTEEFSYTRCGRARIFARELARWPLPGSISPEALIRYNNFLTDPVAKCSGCKTPSPELAIASRLDLVPQGSTFPFPLSQGGCWGAIDGKFTTSSLFKRGKSRVISGPSTGGDGSLPPFSWSTSQQWCKGQPHAGTPEEFKFGWVEM